MVIEAKEADSPITSAKFYMEEKLRETEVLVDGLINSLSDVLREESEVSKAMSEAVPLTGDDNNEEVEPMSPLAADMLKYRNILTQINSKIRDAQRRLEL